MRNSAISEKGRRTAAPPISWLMSLPLQKPNLISLAAGFTDNETLPVVESRKALERVLRNARRGRAALQYGSGAGEEGLRRLTAERIRQQDGAAVSGGYSPDNFLITHGSQQFLYLIAECLCDPGDIVLVEDPTYFVFLSILQSHGVQCRGVRMQGDGMELGDLERVLGEIQRAGNPGRLKMLYMVSYFQNPTGSTTAFEKKKEVLEMLRRYEKRAGHPIFLVEDAAYREMRFAGSDIPSALVIDGASERVIYSGTYSKPFATGVRVGFGAIPEPLRTIVRRMKGNHDFGTSHLLQELLLEAIRSGMYDAHLPVLRKRYARKAGALVSALERHCPEGVTWGEPEGGMYVWARLPKKIRTGKGSEFFERVFAEDVLYVPGEICYADDPSRRLPRNEMRLSFASASEAGIAEGIRRLGWVIGETMSR